jgi:hypothetical protein
MSYLNKFIVFFGIILLLSTFCIAQSDDDSFEVSIEPVKDRIDFQENSRFKITIYNPRSTIERFSIKPAAPYVEWFIKTDPISDYLVKVYPNTKREVFITAKPLNVGRGRYALRLNIKNEKSKELFKKDFVVNIISLSNIPAVSISGKLPEKIDPRIPFFVTVWLENRNSKNLQNLQVQIKSDAIRDSINTTLGPLNSGTDKKTLEFNIKLPDDTPPIKDGLRIVVTAKENDEVYELKSAIFNYEILNYGKLVDNHDKKLKFLGSIDKISFKNDANTKFIGLAKLENPFYKALFTNANPKSKSTVIDGKRYITWNVTLKSQENFNVIVKINFFPLFIVIIIFTSIIIMYYCFRSPIIITKSTKDIVRSEGGITQFKVILHIKNRSKKSIKEVSVIDRIPDIAEFEKEGEIGTLQPVKIAHTKRGIIARWVLNNLEKEEEAVIRYTAKSKLSILGTLPLPIARAKFSNDKNKVKRSYSNTISID